MVLYSAGHVNQSKENYSDAAPLFLFLRWKRNYSTGLTASTASCGNLPGRSQGLLYCVFVKTPQSLLLLLFFKKSTICSCMCLWSTDRRLSLLLAPHWHSPWRQETVNSMRGFQSQGALTDSSPHARRDPARLRESQRSDPYESTSSSPHSSNECWQQTSPWKEYYTLISPRKHKFSLLVQTYIVPPTFTNVRAVAIFTTINLSPIWRKYVCATQPSI